MPSTPLVKNRLPPIEAFICASAIVLATLLLYSNALGNWWGYDDTQILKHALRYSPLEYFFVPDAWRALIAYSLTPWLSLSYDVDNALYGLSPRGFYAHNLLTIALCAWMLYLIAREWVGAWFAAGGAALFLVGSPVAVASQQLMVRHYADGLLFYLFALWLVLCGLRLRQPRYGVLAGVAFLIAATAKEVYLPLGFVPFMLPLGHWRQRLVVAWPLLLVMLLYVPWRWYMLGDVVGGYTPIGTLTDLPMSALLQQFSLIPGLFLDRLGVWILVLGTGLAAAMLWSTRENRWGLLRLGCIVPLLLLAPLVPLAMASSLASERFFVAVWAVLALGVALAFGSVSHNAAVRWVLSALFAALVFVASESSVLLERFFTLNGLGVVVE